MIRGQALKKKLQAGEVAVGFEVLFLGPAHQGQSRDGERYIRHTDFAAQKGSAGHGLLAEKANSAFAHILDPAQHRCLGLLVRF